MNILRDEEKNKGLFLNTKDGVGVTRRDGWTDAVLVGSVDSQNDIGIVN